MRISAAQQENLLVVLCFNNDLCKTVRASVPVELWEGDYNIIATRVYDHIDRHGTAPGQHTSDIFSDLLEGDDNRKGQRWEQLMVSLYGSQTGLNTEYVMTKLHDFVRMQTMKQGIVGAAQLLGQSDGIEAMDKAESTILEALKPRVDLFDPGISMADIPKVLEFMEQDDTDIFTTGIHELDMYGQVPIRKGLHLFIGLAKRGKSWWLQNLAKRALLSRHKVLYVTLELSWQLVAQRLVQSIWGIPKRRMTYETTLILRDSLDRVIDLDIDKINPNISFNDPDARKKIVQTLRQWQHRLKRIRIKQFPTGNLTITGLVAYLDMLEYTEGFIPDLLLLDYADIMTIDPANYRLALGKMYVDLRGLAVTRNMAIATASQSNRGGVGKKKVDEADVAEDFSKIGTVDCAITYSQTSQEQLLGLARLYVAAGRGDRDKYTVLITQNYDTGQFSLDSAQINNHYFDILEGYLNK